MTRINVYDYPAHDDLDATGPVLAGWFDDASATTFGEATDWDGNNDISRATRSQWDHEGLYRTKGGRWVLNRWSQWQGSAPASHEFITDEQAKTWLLTHEHDDAVAEHFGPVEDERGPGRPEVGQAINTRLPEDLLAKVDAYAQEHGVTRAAAIRTLLAERLAQS
jgi:hypothetical protein